MKNKIFLLLLICISNTRISACCDGSFLNVYYGNALAENSVLLIELPGNNLNFSAYYQYKLQNKTTGQIIALDTLAHSKSSGGYEQLVLKPTKSLTLNDSLVLIVTVDTTKLPFYSVEQKKRWLSGTYKYGYISYRNLKVTAKAMLTTPPIPVAENYEYATSVFTSSAGYHHSIGIKADNNIDKGIYAGHVYEPIGLVEVTINAKTYYYVQYHNGFIINLVGHCGSGGHKLEEDVNYTATLRSITFAGDYSKSAEIKFKTGVLSYDNNEDWDKMEKFAKGLPIDKE